ncbi:MAG: phage terminase large subunit [Roseiarcus sp.]
MQIETSDAQWYFIPTRTSRDPLGDHEGDKVMRLFAQTATIENGFVHLPEAAHWLPDHLAEFMLFPNARYDDQVDSTAQTLAWAKQEPGRARNVRMLAAAGGRGRGMALATKQVSRLPPRHCEEPLRRSNPGAAATCGARGPQTAVLWPLD